MREENLEYGPNDVVKLGAVAAPRIEIISVAAEIVLDAAPSGQPVALNVNDSGAVQDAS
jgi:hypothetical protein